MKQNEVFRFSFLYRRCFLMIVILLLFWLHITICVKANVVKNKQHLIQTTNYQDEYEGLRYLDLLRIHPMEEPSVDDVYELIAPTVVRITIGDYAGSGIVVGLSSDKVIILSNKHLLMNAGQGMVSFSQGFDVAGIVTTYSQQLDLAFMEVNISDIPYDHLSELRYVTMKNIVYDNQFSMEHLISTDTASTGVVMTGDPVVLIGSAQKPAGNCEMGAVVEPSAFIVDFYTEMMETDAKAEPGMSGGITCDAYGNMIGMITGDSTEKENCTYSLPVESIIEQIKEMDDIE